MGFKFIKLSQDKYAHMSNMGKLGISKCEGNRIQDWSCQVK